MRKQQQIEAYKHYKSLYPRALLFFHVNNKYVALFDDAQTIAKSQGIALSSETLEYPDTDLHIVSQLGDLGYAIQLIDYRNSEGIYDYPDITLIKSEQKLDY